MWRGDFSCFRWFRVQCSALTWDAASRTRADLDAHRDLVFLAGDALFPMIVLYRRAATSLVALLGGGAADVSGLLTLKDAFPVRVFVKVNSGDSRGSGCSAIDGGWRGSILLCLVSVVRIGDVAAGGSGFLPYVVSSSLHNLPASRSAVSTNMRLRLCSDCMVESLMPRFFLLIAECNSWAASITLSAWDTVGFVRYLCLKKTVLDTRSDRVIFMWIM